MKTKKKMTIQSRLLVENGYNEVKKCKIFIVPTILDNSICRVQRAVKNVRKNSKDN